MYPIIQLLEEPAWPRPQGRVRKSDLLRRVFETFLQRCIREGLVDGEAFAIDACLIKATPKATAREVAEYIAVLDDAVFGAATDVVAKFVGLSRRFAAARWLAAQRQAHPLSTSI